MLKSSLSVVRNALIALFFLMAVVFIRPGVSTAGVGFILEDFLFDVTSNVDACSGFLADCLFACSDSICFEQPPACLQGCSEDCAEFFGGCIESGSDPD